MGLNIHQEKINAESAKALQSLCPFGALEYDRGKLSVNAACKGCRLCVKKGPQGAVTWDEEAGQTEIDRSQWRGVTVFGELRDGRLHPVVCELLGKARELADVIRHPVYAVIIGKNVASAAEDALRYGADRVFTYDDPALEQVTISPYTAAMTDFIRNVKPSAILFGATNLGRSLAPRTAARVGAGLTADCTMLEMKDNTDLVQIRPAFGGNIMARIVSPNARPQFCTVRYKTFTALKPTERVTGEITRCAVTEEMRRSGATVLSVKEKPKQIDLSDAEVIVACGRGFKKKEDLALAQELADALGAQLAGSRPLIENGWLDAKHQIGLSGRTVKPRLIITLGISGAVQFAAGMKASDFIIAVNQDSEAPIFHVAHVGVIGDLYRIVPQLIANIREGKANV